MVNFRKTGGLVGGKIRECDFQLFLLVDLTRHPLPSICRNPICILKFQERFGIIHT